MIKNLLNNFISIFTDDKSSKVSQKPQEPQEPEEPEDKIENSISFIIDEWDRTIIKIKFNNQNLPSSDSFGKMLFMINNGVYENNILNIITDMNHKNPEQSEYIQASLMSWASLIADQIKNNNISGPKVRPTEVFITNNKR